MSNRLFLFLKVLVLFWFGGIYLFLIKPNFISSNLSDSELAKEQVFHSHIEKLQAEINKQSEFYHKLLDKLRVLQKQQSMLNQNVKEVQIEENSLSDGTILPVLLISCNREVAVRRSIERLLKYRPSEKRFPIIVSQDCGHQPTKKVILKYEDKLTLIEQPDLSSIYVPAKEKKFKGYFNIARHYKWALNQIFHKFNYESVIIMEDDLDIAPDFYEYFAATHDLLNSDPTIWCISAWNDNGKPGLIDKENGSSLLYRTDFFPGLGWMMTRDTWGELAPKWPRAYWDDWIRASKQRQDRTCIRPEISRTKTFGKKGVSNGMFYEKFLKYMHLNSVYAEFTKQNLSYLKKDIYDKAFDKEVQRSQVVSLSEVKSGRLPQGTYRLIYHTKDIYKKTAKALGLMDDFKDGVPRTGYRGVVPFFYGGRRIFLAPNNNWKSYDQTWS